MLFRSPANIRLTADRKLIKADGSDLSFVTVEVLDEDGNVVPTADNLIYFEVDGPAFIAGVDNGNPVSHESFKAPMRKAFNGKCLVILQNDGDNGKIKLRVTSDGLTPQELTIVTQP